MLERVRNFNISTEEEEKFFAADENKWIREDPLWYVVFISILSELCEENGYTTASDGELLPWNPSMCEELLTQLEDEILNVTRNEKGERVIHFSFNPGFPESFKKYLDFQKEILVQLTMYKGIMKDLDDKRDG